MRPGDDEAAVHEAYEGRIEDRLVGLAKGAMADEQRGAAAAVELVLAPGDRDRHLLAVGGRSARDLDFIGSRGESGDGVALHFLLRARRDVQVNDRIGRRGRREAVAQHG